MGWLEIVLLGIGATILAVNQMLKDARHIRQRIPALRPRGWWSYLPLIFVTLATVVYFGRPLLPERAAPDPPPPAIRGIPVERIRAAFEGRTDAEVAAMSRPFIERRVIIEGTIGGVYGVETSRIIRLHETIADGAYVQIFLSHNQGAFAGGLGVGDRIRGYCTLYRADRYGFTVHQCLMPGAPPPPPGPPVESARNETF